MKTQRIWGSLDPFHESGPILGRKVANSGFLNGLLEIDPFDEYHFFLSGAGGRQGLTKFIQTNYPAIFEADRVKFMDRRDLPAEIAKREYFCFHQSDCINYPPHLARVRNKYARNIFPITGTTHSLSYSNYGSFFLNYLWKGTTGRDCIVTTSSTGIVVVEKYFKHLREGLGLIEETHPTPQIRKIPLGINPGQLAPPDEHLKAQAKRNLDIDAADERINILVFGRIAHHSKMDILPLLRALQRLFAAGMNREKVRVLLGGWVDEDDDFPATLTQLARNMGLELIIFGRPSEAKKLDLYQAADIFVSISDNPQETFGLTVLEAGASGLPVIASDYDGYKDLVVDGETGLLIETIGPEATPELDLMAPLCFDNHYHLLMAQQTAVNTPKLAEGLEKLINDPLLRSQMGTAGAKRVREQFNWTKVIEQHITLWEELNTAPVDEKALRDILHPVQVRMGETFSHYLTETLSPETKLVTGITGRAIYQGREFPLMYKGVDRFLKEEVIRKMAFFARKPISAADLAEKIKTIAGEMGERETEFHILWSLKHDILEKNMLKRSVVHHTILKKSGGAARVAQLLHQGLLDGGHNSVHSFETSEAAGEDLLAPEAAAQTIPEESIVHLHTSKDPVKFLRALPDSCKTVITLHDSQLITGGCASPIDCPEFEQNCCNCPRNFPNAEQVRKERIAAIIDSKAVLISPSGWLGRLARKAEPALKPKIIPNGIPWPETPANKNQIRREIGIHPASKVMLFVAHGGEQAAYKSGPQWKNYWATIKAAVPEALCFAIGGNENSRNGDFISVPYVDSHTLSKFLAAADVLAYPTLGDNHPLIILEAMAQGLTTVSYAVGGVLEQISDGDDGILIPPYEKQMFAEKVIMLLKNSRIAREMGNRGFQKGRKRYSDKRMLSDYLKIYGYLM